ncbi:MAG: MFS transporter [Holophagales bacterium]|nr:MFS transporter [Holophagales bacterium]
MSFAWLREATPEARRALFAATSGWMLDAMDVMLYAFALTAIRAEFGLDGAQAGLLASVTLVASAVGGIGAGILADRFGRARILVLSILAYALFTGATATSRTVAELALWRALVGLGLGAEWSAGSVLVAETWPSAHRGKAIGLMQSGWAIGYVLAALLAAAVIPRFGWRPLFLLGVLPALLAVWVRWRVPEPAIWKERGAGTKKGRASRSSSGRLSWAASSPRRPSPPFCSSPTGASSPGFRPSSPRQRRREAPGSASSGRPVSSSPCRREPSSATTPSGSSPTATAAARFSSRSSSARRSSSPPSASSPARRRRSSFSPRSSATSGTATSRSLARSWPSSSPRRCAAPPRASATTPGALSARSRRSRSAPSPTVTASEAPWP